MSTNSAFDIGPGVERQKLRGVELNHRRSLDLGKQEAERERQRNTGMAGVENNVLCCIDHRPVSNRCTCGYVDLRRKK